MIRQFREGDAARLSWLDSHPDVVRFQDYDARTAEDAQGYLHRYFKALVDEPGAWVEFAIVDDFDELIGRTGASVIGRTAFLWYVLHPDFHGRGIASSAVQELISHLVGVETLEIECDPLNTASRRLALRLGFELVSEASSGYIVKGVDTGSCVFRCLAQSSIR